MTEVQHLLKAATGDRLEALIQLHLQRVYAVANFSASIGQM